MIKLTQLILHDPENDQYGDCFRTCIACLLEIEDISSVPHFCDNTNERWVPDLNKRLGNFGYAYIDVTGVNNEWYREQGINTHHVISGMGPRGTRHSVIGLNGEIVWDPHPSRDGLSCSKEEYEHGYIIKLS